jgi:dTDP-4-dehydrorhamnose reductase
LHPDQARRAIVDATRNLVDVMDRLDPTASFVMVSTDQVYNGNPLGKKRYDESDLAQPLSTYGTLKREAEEIVYQLPYGVVVRSALIYGPPATYKQSFLAWMLGTLGRGEPVTLFEDEWRTPIHVNDLIDGLMAVARQRKDGLYLAGGTDQLSRMMMGEVACDLFGYSRSLLMPSRLSDSNYPAPRPANVSLDSRKLEALVGRPFRTFREGLRSIEKS